MKNKKTTKTMRKILKTTARIIAYPFILIIRTNIMRLMLKTTAKIITFPFILLIGTVQAIFTNTVSLFKKLVFGGWK